MSDSNNSNLVDIAKIIGDKRQKAEMKKLDAQASYTAIDTCLTYLNMNKIEGMDKLKDEMKKAMKMLAEIGKNG